MFLNGTGKRSVLTPQLATYMGVQGEFLYWVELHGTIMRADKFTGGDAVVLGHVDYQPSALQVFAKQRQNCKLSQKV